MITVLAVCVCIGSWPGQAYGSAATLGAGNWAVKEAASYWYADRKFASSLDALTIYPGRGPVRAGDRVPFDPLSATSELQIAGVTTQLTYGITDWFDLGAAIPGLVADFHTAPVSSVDPRAGLGDLTLTGQAKAFELGDLVAGARVEWKLPIGYFDPSVYSAPIAEGQMDVAVVPTLAYSLGTFGYVAAQAGRKFRLANPANGRRPGDEWLATLEGGKDLPFDLHLKLALDGLWGDPGEMVRFGAVTPLPRRQAYSVWADLQWRASGWLLLEAGDRYFFGGEDYPAGHQVFAGATQLF